MPSAGASTADMTIRPSAMVLNQTSQKSSRSLGRRLKTDRYPAFHPPARSCRRCPPHRGRIWQPHPRRVRSRLRSPASQERHHKRHL
jgi:hypothetical protein